VRTACPASPCSDEQPPGTHQQQRTCRRRLRSEGAARGRSRRQLSPYAVQLPWVACRCSVSLHRLLRWLPQPGGCKQCRQQQPRSPTQSISSSKPTTHDIISVLLFDQNEHSYDFDCAGCALRNRATRLLQVQQWCRSVERVCRVAIGLRSVANKCRAFGGHCWARMSRQRAQPPSTAPPSPCDFGGDISPPVGMSKQCDWR